jgi:hypothetical protein
MLNDTIQFINGHKFVGVTHDFTNCEKCQMPVITHANYAKNMYAVNCPNYTDFKTREMTIAERITKRYSNRESAYIMSKNQVKKFIEAIKPIMVEFYHSEFADWLDVKESEFE